MKSRAFADAARLVAGTIASTLLLALVARGHAWAAFVALVPWLLALDALRSWRGALVGGLAMSVGYVAAALAWFGSAIGAYTGIGSAAGTALLLIAGPLLQPQVLAFVVVRRLVTPAHGATIAALAGAAAWVGCEWVSPKLLGDTLGHGLAPATVLRQAADLGGAAGLTVILLLVNEAITRGLRETAQRAPREAIVALTSTGTLVAGLWGYGQWRLADLARAYAEPAPTLRVAMVQSAIVDYEARRREVGAYAVVREVLDVHFALSREAIERHGAEALLWSETVYPTTFGQPRSEDGAALDREILDFAAANGIPLVFGTYEEAQGREYNVAAVVEPAGIIGRYRKTHPFPLTEHVPAWLDGPGFRRAFPWAGTWQPGDGARVLPLRAADGRQLEVVPLVCLDDVRPRLAIDGARLGAQAIVGLSNDAWFSDDPLGAELHLTVAVFRSIETRLPQLRVTTNGLSAFVDPSGEVLARTGMGDRAVLAGEVPIVDPPPTLMVRLGDWVGGAGLAFLGLLAVTSRVRRHGRIDGAPASASAGGAPFDGSVVAWSPTGRAAAGALRLIAACGLAVLAVRMLTVDGLAVNSLVQVRIFAGAVLLPLLLAWALARWHAGQARIDGALLVIETRSRRIEIPLGSIAALRPWRLPLPTAGVDLVLGSGRAFQSGLGLADPRAFAAMLEATGSPARFATPRDRRAADLAAIRAATPASWLDRGWFRFGLFPLLPALVAFRLHQVIAYGGTFGEWLSFGPEAWWSGLAIWWAAWALGLMLFAAGLRLAIEAATAAALLHGEDRAVGVRRMATRFARLAYFVGVPAWLLTRVA